MEGGDVGAEEVERGGGATAARDMTADRTDENCLLF